MLPAYHLHQPLLQFWLNLLTTNSGSSISNFSRKTHNILLSSVCWVWVTNEWPGNSAWYRVGLVIKQMAPSVPKRICNQQWWKSQTWWWSSHILPWERTSLAIDSPHSLQSCSARYDPSQGPKLISSYSEFSAILRSCNANASIGQ